MSGIVAWFLFASLFAGADKVEFNRGENSPLDFTDVRENILQEQSEPINYCWQLTSAFCNAHAVLTNSCFGNVYATAFLHLP